MDATELMVRGIVVGLFQENCYIIGSRTTGEAICVDPGDEIDEIRALAREMRVTITKIACSHAHVDHIMAVSPLKEETGATFLLHRADLDLARRMPDSALSWLQRYEPPPPDPDFFLDEGDDIEIPGIVLRTLHTPGHTQGSICLYGGGMLFSGDTLFRSSIGRTDLPGGSFPQIMESITTRLLALPDDTVVLPGHMQQTTIGAERAGNPFILEALARRRSG
jgi:glyoxylase-like metal-dependent hydrolase (beta-lactamase superfamily II)